MASQAESAQRAREELAAEYDFVDVDRADVIIALGGDGFLLHSLHQYQEAGVPIYGMNLGTLGFLMNEYRKEDLMERIRRANPEPLNPLRMVVTDASGRAHEHYAFNEVSLIRLSHQSANIRVTVNDRERIARLVCDGILVATPAGSTHRFDCSAGSDVLGELLHVRRRWVKSPRSRPPPTTVTILCRMAVGCLGTTLGTRETEQSGIVRTRRRWPPSDVPYFVWSNYRELAQPKALELTFNPMSALDGPAPPFSPS